MKKEQIPEIFVNDREKTFTFLTQLMKGKQNVNKQSVMVVGQGSFLPILPLLLIFNIILILFR